MILLDTHAWWWALSEPERLSDKAAQVINSVPRDQLAVAGISLWELSLLFSRQKISLNISPEEWFEAALDCVRLLTLTPEIALEAYRLPGSFHKDPADRIIVSTARRLDCTLVTRDDAIRNYPFVKTVW